MAVGCPHPDYLDSILNRRQIYEWMSYDAMQPFGDQRRDISLTHQAFWIRSAMLTEDDGIQPKDMMPPFDSGLKSEAQQIADEILESL